MTTHSMLDTLSKSPFREAHILLMLSCRRQKYLLFSSETSTLEIIVEAGAPLEGKALLVNGRRGILCEK